MIEFSHEWKDHTGAAHSIKAKIETHLEDVRDNVLRGSIIRGMSGKDIPPAETIIAFFDYPVCVSCSRGTMEIDGAEYDVRALTYEQFCALPGQLYVAWSDRVMRDNPHFLEVPDDKKVTSGGDEAKKKK